jgi:hypothetical protein
MNRQTIWAICSAVVTVAVLSKENSAPTTVLIGFYTIIGVPLFLHWLTEKREVRS